jgi:phosphatidylglycerophosphatase A
LRTRAVRWLATPIATCFGVGLAPFAPGTAGSIVAIAAAALLIHYHGWTQANFGLLCIVSLLPGIWAAQVYAESRGKEDPSEVVVDEVIGQWVTLLGATVYNWKSLLAALVLFRILDIFKPFPIRQAEKLPGGVGIIADDVVAGVVGALVLFAAGCFNLY